jgi:hypothetical protein
LIVDVSEVKLPGEMKQNNRPPKCGQPIDAGVFLQIVLLSLDKIYKKFKMATF